MGPSILQATPAQVEGCVLCTCASDGGGGGLAGHSLVMTRNMADLLTLLERGLIQTEFISVWYIKKYKVV